MKTLSGAFTFKLTLLTAIAIVAVVTFRAFATPTPTPTPAKKFQFVLEFGNKTSNPPEYVDLATQNSAGQREFDCALRALKENGGDIREVGFKKNATAPDIPVGSYSPTTCRTESINTDKITTSELAKNAPAEESSGYDPNAVYRVMSNSIQDIKKVLDTFKTPTPTPTPP